MAGAGLAWKLVGTGAAIGAGILARKLATSAWKLTTGKQPPANPQDPEVTFAEAATWAALSGVIVGLARMVAGKKVAEWWQRSTGKLPPNLHKVSP